MRHPAISSLPLCPSAFQVSASCSCSRQRRDYGNRSDPHPKQSCTSLSPSGPCKARMWAKWNVTSLTGAQHPHKGTKPRNLRPAWPAEAVSCTSCARSEEIEGDRGSGGKSAVGARREGENAHGEEQGGRRAAWNELQTKTDRFATMAP